jgi:uncharacterized membrane protein YeiH
MQVPPLLEHSAIAVGALTGVLAAKGRGLDLFGVVVLALVAALGGGSLRDVLAGDVPVAWLRNPALLYTAGGTALVAFFVCKTWEPPARLLQVADAFGLALFTIAGTQKGHLMGFSNAAAIVLGVITGVAGGIIRDVLTSRVPLVFQRDTYYYATAAFAGAVAYSGLKPWLGDVWAPWFGVAIALTLRLSALRYRLALPTYP